MPYGQINADVIGTSVAGSNLGAGNSSLMKNKIINGSMTIDQRNAGASVNPTDGQYTLDRWFIQRSQASKLTVQQNAGSVTPPVGFKNYLGVTSSSAYSITSSDYFTLQQRIEGFNVADLGWGTASAKTITISFQVYSSLTGTFGGSLLNSAANRSYPFTYTISSANTWTSISITIAGDTSGTWLSTTGIGIDVCFGLGVGSISSATAGAWTAGGYNSATGATSVVGTNGATFYITGVQLEVGSSSTGYEYENYGQTLAKCQRYYYKIKAEGIATTFASGVCQNTTSAVGMTTFPVTMRIAPTALEQSGTASDYRIFIAAGTTCTSVPALSGSTGSPYSVSTNFTASGLTGGFGCLLQALTANAYLAWSAEL